MTAAVDQIRDAIVAVLDSVPGTGEVHAFERYAATEKGFQQLYLWNAGGDTRQIRGWHVRRVAWRESLHSTGRNVVAATWRLSAFMALADADESERAFDAMLDTAADAFRADPSLGGAVFDTTTGDKGASAGLQLVTAEPVMLAGVLCHSAHLTLTTLHFVDQ